jgi:glyoxylase I family protein
VIPNPRIGAICYYVARIDRTEAFYRDVIGLDVKRMGDGGSGHEWLMATISGKVELIFFQKDSRPGDSPIIVFDLPEGGIDGVIESLAAKGATIVTPVSEAPGGWSGEFADPDGHVLSLYQSEAKPRRKA